ncbi:NACHT domain-containing protein [Pseudanabaena sp. FACHB-1998]|uniref:NACHT domain-containing protein n=1 Tax=Pseudanabaena sp. FACHB-1998 TaxID=2692858 RepID=UPI001680D50B|nr:NACHT domain-containing protein [Pseudanabaena sp. FACHB-1998]MBD2179452.1 NACHT domain-containing protein [Pseudanabaena sp. FACHB-1998]
MTRKYDNRGRDQINIENGNVLLQNQSAQNQNEQLILRKVNLEVNSRLEDSLHNRIFVNLDKQSQPEQVERLWDTQIKIGAKAPAPISTNTSILEVFERSDIAGHLLILGNLGAGKTTTMLDLAKSLVEKVEQDSDEPIPVIINLSSWKNLRQSMSEWLIEELNSKYKISKDIFRKCLEDKRLLPMLDGLDEVKPEFQESCIDAINLWLNDELCPLFIVICSRQEEYANHQTQLNLNGAILLEALTDNQIQSYLANVNRNELWELLRSNSELLELVRTPLLLSITILSYNELSLDEWHKQNSTKNLIKLLLDAYIQAMFRRKFRNVSYINDTLPADKQTKYWLKFLALQMGKESQTEFLVEKMHPSTWLLNTSKIIYRFIIGLILFLLFVMPIRVIFGDILGSIMALSIGLVLGYASMLEIKLAETFDWSFTKAKKSFLSWFIPSMIIIILVGIIVGIVDWIRYSPIHGVLMMFAIILILGFFISLMAIFSSVIDGLDGMEIALKTIPNQGIWKSANNALFTSLFCVLTFGITGLSIGLCGGMLFGEILDKMSFGIIAGLVYGLFFGLMVGLKFGGFACIQHFILRTILSCNRVIPWNYAGFLNYCTERLFLQRVGGRYRFIHRLLQEHFAEMEI